MMRKLRIIPFEEGILGGYHSHNKPGGGRKNHAPEERRKRGIFRAWIEMGGYVGLP